MQDRNQDKQPEEIDSAMEVDISQDQYQYRPPTAINPEMEISQDQDQYQQTIAIDPNMEISQDQDQYRPPTAINPEIQGNISQDQSKMDNNDDPDYRQFLQNDAINGVDAQQQQPRRSSRIPKLSVRALERFQYDQ